MGDEDLVRRFLTTRIDADISVVGDIDMSSRRVIYLEKHIRRVGTVVISNAVQIRREKIARVDDFAFGGIPASLP